MPRKTLHLTERELRAWRTAAEYVGVSLDELIKAATSERVAEIELHRTEDLALDRFVRAQSRRRSSDAHTFRAMRLASVCNPEVEVTEEEAAKPCFKKPLA